jgi:hypothetical protein
LREPTSRQRGVQRTSTTSLGSWGKMESFNIPWKKSMQSEVCSKKKYF